MVNNRNKVSGKMGCFSSLVSTGQDSSSFLFVIRDRPISRTIDEVYGPTSYGVHCTYTSKNCWISKAKGNVTI